MIALPIRCVGQCHGHPSSFNLLLHLCFVRKRRVLRKYWVAQLLRNSHYGLRWIRSWMLVRSATQLGRRCSGQGELDSPRL